MKYAFSPSVVPHIPVQGKSFETENLVFPVHRIYCVAKNYAEHIREMGDHPTIQSSAVSSPVFFTKPPDAIVHAPSSSDSTLPRTTIPYALATKQLDHEIELVLAIGRSGINIPDSKALEYVYGYAVGVDLTRRDLQAIAKRNKQPWDAAKAFDQSAPMASILAKASMTDTEHEHLLQSANIWLNVNETRKQQGKLSDMIHTVPEIVAEASKLFHLQPGDLIFTGTPSGVGPLIKGDTVTGGIDGLPSIEFTIV
ncbi:hypothetical protein MPSEU_000877200 [Mayamaea pseudoterrestris]|nr:hypothetical protein MPSEU_000877200 [Mayamaea pseudoterrestris]